MLVADDRPVAQALALPAQPSAGSGDWLIDIVGLDEDGRVALSDAAFEFAWDGEVALVLDEHGSWLKVTEAPRRHRGESAHLGGRNRLAVPLLWRRLQGLSVGSRLCVRTGLLDGEPAVTINPVRAIAGVLADASPVG